MSIEIHNTPWDSLPGKKKRKVKTKYPWDLWFNGKTHLLIAGEDFKWDIRLFRGYIYDVATMKGLRVKTALTESEDALYVRRLGRKRKPTRVDPVVQAVLNGTFHTPPDLGEEDDDEMP